MSFFSSLMGKDAANAANALGQRNASQINQGYGSADAYAGQGYQTSMGRYEPYAQQGQKGFGAYYDAMGMNGDAARQKQFQSFQSSPFLQYAQQNSGNQLNAMFSKYNASGQGNSGASRLAISRAAGERAQGDVNNYLAQLQGMANQGVGIAGAQAGLDQNYYGGMADRAVGRANALAQNDTNATTAASNARQAGVNNLLGMAGTVVGMGARGYFGGR